ncbi:hypothetical protein JCM8097_009385 [Rhodosporidiobolus ruineniae]
MLFRLPLVALAAILVGLLDNRLVVSSALTHCNAARSPADIHARFLESASQPLNKRQPQTQEGTAPGAAVQGEKVGTENPAPGTLNNFKVEEPSKSDGGGGIAAFNKRSFADVDPDKLEARQAPAPGAAEQKGTANPAPADADLNNKGDNDPLKSTPGGGMTPFARRSPSPNAAPEAEAVAFAHPVPLPHQLNRMPHHLATRGLKGGVIEMFGA